MATALHRVRALGLIVSWLCACEINCSPTFDADVDVATPSTPATAAPSPRSAGDPSSACAGPVRDGTTSCFPGECSVGQHCDDRDMPHCEPGCVSDENCGARDICVREGNEVLGRCEPCAAHDAHEPAPGCVVATRSGTTACFPGECPVGQRCVDRGMPHCEPGCLTDDNCGPSEQCVREPSAMIGACRSCFY